MRQQGPTQFDGVFTVAGVGVSKSIHVEGVSFIVSAVVNKYLYFGGRMLKRLHSVSPGAATWMPQQDRLGSTVRHLPYGEENTPTANGQFGAQKFATYWREDSGLDYAMNRYYSSVYGRFTTADPYRASGGPANPGSWNRYSYVGGDPVNFYDPTGLLAVIPPMCRETERGLDCSPGSPEEPDEMRPSSPPSEEKPLSGPLLGLASASKALRTLSDRGITCPKFFEELAKESGLQREFSIDTFRAVAGEILGYNNGQSALYIGEGNDTPLGKAIGLPESMWTDLTVGDHFKDNPNVVALSQPNGLAIWIRDSTFPTHPTLAFTPAAGALMMHEVLHKFLGPRLHSAAANAANRLWGPGVTQSNWTDFAQTRCFDYQ